MMLLISMFFLFVPHSVSALTDVVLDDPTQVTSYEITLVYDDTQSTLRLPKDAKQPYVIVRDAFVPDPRAFQGDFIGFLIGPNEKIYKRFGVPLPEGVTTGSLLTYQVKAPYDPSAERIDIYKGAQKLIALDVTGSRICIEDGICRREIGENAENCPVDCVDIGEGVAEVPKVAQQSPSSGVVSPSSLPPRANPPQVIGDEDRSPLLLYALISFLLGVGSFFAWAYMRRRSRT